MNLTVILATAVLWGATLGGAFYYGQNVGANAEIAKQAAVNQAIEDTRKAALEGAADAIAKIQVRNTTIKGKTETIVRENVVYRDCRHSPDGVRVLNEALTGRAGSDGGRSVPGVNAVK